MIPDVSRSWYSSSACRPNAVRMLVMFVMTSLSVMLVEIFGSVPLVNTSPVNTNTGAGDEGVTASTAATAVKVDMCRA